MMADKTMSVKDSNITITTPTHKLCEKVSAAFSSTSSAASATSAGTPRSGGSRLLFGEIDTSSERSSESYASVCNLVLSASSTFLRFWLADECREALLSELPASDLASLRLVCHDFSVRAAPALFSDLTITFRPNTFTRPSKQAALQRLGFYVKTLSFNIPHSRATFLPPLIEPETGDELNYTYIPRIQPLAIRQPRYGDWETTEILTRQYPPLFHAATNVDAFVQAFSAFVNLEHLKISCPGSDTAVGGRRSVVDFALISTRIAVERNCFNSLHTLTVSPIHPTGLIYFTSTMGYGASPASQRRWSRIKTLNLHVDVQQNAVSSEHIKLLHTFLTPFKRTLESFQFKWNNHKGPLPLYQAVKAATAHPAMSEQRPSTAPNAKSNSKPLQGSMHFPRLRRLEIENATAQATEIATIVAMHKRTLEELDLQAIDLSKGTWEQAFAPLTKMAARSQRTAVEMADIPIMLSPTTGCLFPRPMERVEVVQEQHRNGRRSLRASRWFGAKMIGSALPKTPLLPSAAATFATRKVKHGLSECENQMKRVLKGTVFSWL